MKHLFLAFSLLASCAHECDCPSKEVPLCKDAEVVAPATTAVAPDVKASVVDQPAATLTPVAKVKKKKGEK